MGRANRVKELLHAALEREQPARETFVREQAAGDEGLRREVEELIAAHDLDDGSFLRAPALGVSAAALVAQAAADGEKSPVGERVGPYSIVREIGRGGMGAVYLAERADGEFRQRVAVKLIKRGMDTDFILRRFRNERQILATLDHPYIARLLDGGTTDDGLPYFVMEHIEGLPIDRYADAHRLSVAERLALFALVCDAVEYAHRRKVVHRDLKPGNIMITPDGVPKLLDFGIAKLLDVERASHTPDATATVLRVMTPEYASPEQLRGEPVTARSDVYALGVLLYELLTGSRPYHFGSRLPHDVLETILGGALARPSSAVSRSAGSPTNRAQTCLPSRPEEVAGLRGASPEQLRRWLRGDLDTIIMAALRREPERRYGSAADFGDDVRRRLEGRTVLARRDSPVYRARTFLRRHRTSAFISSAVAALFLALGLFIGLVSEKEAPRESVAVLPFVNAGQDAGAEYLADGMSEYLTGYLSRLPGMTVPGHNSVYRFKGKVVDPPATGRALGVETLLKGRVVADDENLSLELEMVDTASGRTLWRHRQVGSVTDIQTLQQGAAEAVSRRLGITPPDEARTGAGRRRAGSPEVYRLYLKGHYFWGQRTILGLNKATEYFRKAVELDPQYAPAYSGLANSYSLLAAYKDQPPHVAFPQAKEAALKAVELDPGLAEGHTSLALVLWLYDWDWPAADKEFRLALACDPRYPTAPHWYGLYLAEMGRFDEAVASEQRALELDPLSLYITADLGRVYFYARRYDDSLRQYRKAIEMDPTFGAFYAETSELYAEMGMWDEYLSAWGRNSGGVSVERDVLARSGPKGFLRLIAQTTERTRRNAWLNYYWLATAYSRLGESDKAFEFLYKAREAHDHQMAQLKVNPAFDPLRSDSRFDLLLRGMNLKP